MRAQQLAEETGKLITREAAGMVSAANTDHCSPASPPQPEQAGGDDYA